MRPPPPPSFSVTVRRELLARHPDALPFLNEIEHWARQLHDKYRVSVRFAGPSTRAEMEVTAVELVQACISRAQVYNLRELADLVEDVIRAVNAGRVLSCALAGRAALESVAALAHFEGHAVRLLGGTVTPAEQWAEVMNKVDQDAIAARVDWERWWGGTESRRMFIAEFEASGQARVDLHPNRVNVNTLLAALDRRYRAANPARAGRVAMYYALLSDIVHPSWGRRLLYSEPGAPQGWAATIPHPHPDMVFQLYYDVVFPALVEALTHAASMASNLRGMADSVREQPR